MRTVSTARTSLAKWSFALLAPLFLLVQSCGQIVLPLAANVVPQALSQNLATEKNLAKDIVLAAIDNGPLIYSIVTPPAHGTLSAIDGATLTYTPANNYTGIDSFVFKANDGEIDSNIASIVIVVNNAPVATAQSISLAEDTSKTITLAATDVEGSPLSYSVATQPAHGSLSAINGTTLTYTPQPDFFGNDSFTFRANDGFTPSLPATVSITVTPVQDAPVATPFSVTATEDTGKSIVMQAIDVDGDPLTYTIVANPTHGSLSGLSGNTVTYSPVANYNGADSFTFRVNDGHVNSATAKATITVVPVNDAPTASSQSITTAEDTAKLVTFVGADIDSATLSYIIVTQPTFGTLSVVNGNTVTYTPVLNYHGTDSFTFRTSDGALSSAPATVNVVITSVNDAPTAANVSKTTPINVPADIVMVGDDVDGDGLIYTIVTPPSHGSLGTVSGPGVTYTSNNLYAGADSFSYRVSDGMVNSNVATVSLTVQALTPVVLSVSSATVKSPAVVAYTLAGGAPPFVVTSTQGKISNSTANGSFDPDGDLGPTTITVTDAAAQTSQKIVTAYNSPRIGVQAPLPSDLNRYYGGIAAIAGKFYSFGGHTGSVLSNDLKVFDPAIGTQGGWKTLSPSGTAPTARFQHSVVAIGRKLYVFGGTGNTQYNDLSVYDPYDGAQGKWTTLNPTGDILGTRYGHMAAVAAGKMYIFNGNGQSGYTKELDVYDPSVGTDGKWKKLSPTGVFPSQRSFGNLVSMNGKLYLFGGSAGTNLNDLRVYDPSIGTDGSWTLLAPSGTIPSKRQAAAATVIQGKMYLFGGSDASGYTNDTFVFDPTAVSWTTLSPAGGVQPKRQLASVTVISGKMFVYGGSTQSGISSELRVFDPSTGANGTWSTLTPIGFSNSSSVIASGTLNYFVSGGVAPLSITSTSGSLSSSTGSGVLTAPATTGSLTMTVADAQGETDSASISVKVPLVFTLAQTTMTSSSSMTYTISGGTSPYSVSANTGYINNDIFYANGSTGVATLTATDAGGNTIQAQVTITYTSLSLNFCQDFSSPSGSFCYWISGGDGTYSASVSAGSVDNSTGDGTWYMPATPGVATMTVTDGSGEVVRRSAVITSPLSLTIGNTTLNYGETTTYTVSGGSGSYSMNGWCGGYDNSSGSGNYTAWCNGTDMLGVYDNNTGENVSLYITINAPVVSFSLDTSPMLVGEKRNYTITNGGGNFQVSTNSGFISNNYDSGYYSPTVPGDDTIYTYNYWDNSQAQYTIRATGSIKINLSQEAIGVGGSTSYWIDYEQAPPYTYTTNFGSINNPSGSGTFTAPGTAGIATISVTDALGNTGSVSVTITSTNATWSKITNFRDRYGATLVEISGKLYQFGGYANSRLNDVAVFNPSDSTFKILSPTGTAPSPSQFHTAVAMNSKMYIFGGDTDGGTSNTLYAYDPATGTDGAWTTVAAAGTKPTARYKHSAVVMNNKMYVFGGNASGNSNGVYVYDPATGAQGTWTTLSPAGTAPSPRNAHNAVSINNKMYVFGGNSNANYWNNDLNVFDPAAGANGTWSQPTPAGSIPYQRFNFGATVISGKMYVFSGSSTNGQNGDLYSYDPSAGANGTWAAVSAAGTLPAGRTNPAMTAYNGKIYVIGGSLNAARYNNIQVWDSAVGTNGTWSTINPDGLAPSMRNGHAQAVIGTKMYIFGGYTNGGTANDLSVYDLVAQTWKRLTPTGTAPSVRSSTSITVLGSKIYIFGGTGATRFDELYSYDPSVGSDGAWTLLAPSGNIPLGRYYASLSATGGKLYVFGGHTGSFAMNDISVYDPAAGAQGTWTELNPSGSTPDPVYMQTASVINGKIYYYGGYVPSINAPSSKLWVFDPALGTDGKWSLLAPTGSTPNARYGHSTTVISNKMYLFGGYGANGTIVSIYDPSIGTDGKWLVETATGATPPILNNHSAISYSGAMYTFGGNPLNNDIYIYQPAP